MLLFDKEKNFCYLARPTFAVSRCLLSPTLMARASAQTGENPEILPGRARLWFAAFYELYDSVKFTKIQFFCIIVKDCSFFVEYQGDYFLGCEYKKNNSKRLNRHRTFSLYVLSLCGDFEV